MSGRFMSPIDVAAARKETEIFNSRLKRGEVPYKDKILRSAHVVCGCGREGCIFITHWMKEENGPNGRTTK